MMVLIMTIIVLGVVGSNMTQMKASTAVQETLQAKELAMGAMARMHQIMLDNCPAAAGCKTPGVCSTCPLATGESETIDGRVYNVLYVNDPDDATYNGTDQYHISVNY